MNLFTVGDEVSGRTVDLAVSASSWLIGFSVDRMKVRGYRERVIRIHLGPLHLTIWRGRDW